MVGKTCCYAQLTPKLQKHRADAGLCFLSGDPQVCGRPFFILHHLARLGLPPKRAVCSAHVCALLPQVGGRGATHLREVAAIAQHRVLLVGHVDKPLRRNLSALIADRFESLREGGEEVGRRHMASLDGFLATLLLFYGGDESSLPAGGMLGLHWLRATSTSLLQPAMGRPPAAADESPVLGKQRLTQLVLLRGGVRA